MKTAIYIEDGVVQLVITPESKFEKNALSTIQSKSIDAEIFSGSFYDCRGGWTRQSSYYPKAHYISYETNNDDKSLIIRVNEKVEREEEINEHQT